MFASHGYAQADDDAFERLTINDGLSSNSIKDIVQDSSGMLWFGTTNGLNRYDGKNFKVYKHTTEDNSLCSNNISSLLVRHDGSLWIGTPNNGLSKYNENGTFSNYVNISGDSTSLSNNQVWHLFEDSNQNLWVSTQGGISIQKKGTQVFHNYPSLKDDGIKSKVQFSFEDRWGNLWLGTWDQGLFFAALDQETGAMKFEKVESALLKNSKVDLAFTCINQDSRGAIYLGTASEGLFCLKLEKPKKFSSLEEVEINIQKLNAHLKDSFVNDIQFIGDSKLQIAGYSGTHIVDVMAENSVPYVSQNSCHSSENSGLKNGRVDKMFRDKSGINWILTGKGVLKDIRGRHRFKVETPIELCEFEFGISSIEYDTLDDALFMGTTNGVLLKKQADKESILFESESKSDINSILLEENEIWFGTATGQLFNITEGTLVEKPIKLSKNISFYGSNIFEIVRKNKSQLWIVSSQGLILYNHKDEKIVQVNGSDFVIKGNVYDLVSVVEDEYWAIVCGEGLFKLEERNGSTFDIVKFGIGEKKDEIGLRNSILFDMEVSGSSLWLSSDSGIQRFDLTKEAFEVNSKLENKINGEIKFVESLDENRILYSTYDQLGVFNYKTDELVSFNRFDGVMEDIALRSSEGVANKGVFFGGHGGYQIVDINDLVFESEIDLQIRDLKLYNESVEIGKRDEQSGSIILKEDISKTEKIELSHDQDLVTLEYSVLDFIDPYQFNYKYKLDGFDKKWSQPSAKTSVTYTNLDPKCYTFSVMAQNKYGQWSKQVDLIIDVKPAFWMTNWFRLICMLMGCLIIAQVLRFKDNLAKRRRDELQLIIDDKTKALRSNIKELKTKEKNLQQINTELKKYIESNNQLEQFASMASHDLKAPLRTIISFAELLSKKPVMLAHDKEREYLSFISKAAKNLNDLIGSLLEFSKIEGDKLVFEQVSVIDILKELKWELSANIIEKDAELIFEGTFPDVIVSDKIKIKQVFQNLISNALKYVAKDVRPKVIVSFEETQEYWKFHIKDNGIGIDDAYKEKVFLMFSRLVSAKNYEGSGIGLAICQKIVTKHNGFIQIADNVPQGCVFSFAISKNLVSNQKEKEFHLTTL